MSRMISAEQQKRSCGHRQRAGRSRHQIKIL